MPTYNELTLIVRSVCLESPVTNHPPAYSDARGDVSRGLEVVEQACTAGVAMMGETLGGIANGLDVFSYREPLGVCAGTQAFETLGDFFRTAESPRASHWPSLVQLHGKVEHSKSWKVPAHLHVSRCAIAVAALISFVYLGS